MNNIEFIQKTEASLKINFGERNLIGYTIKLIAKKFNDKRNDNVEAVLNHDTLLNSSNYIDGVAYIKVPSNSTNINVGEYNFQIELINGTFREAYKSQKLSVFNNYNKE